MRSKDFDMVVSFGRLGFDSGDDRNKTGLGKGDYFKEMIVTENLHYLTLKLKDI